MKRFLRLGLITGAAILAYNGNAQCPAGQVETYIDVLTDDFGYECYWELVPNGNACGTGTVFAGGNMTIGCNGGGAQNQNPGGYGNNTTITEGPWCLTENADYDIISIDDWGDAHSSYMVNIEGFPMYQFDGLNGNTATVTFTAKQPLDYDFTGVNITTFDYSNPGGISITGHVKNISNQMINSFDVNYSIENGTPVTSNVTTPVNPFVEYEFDHPTLWNPTVNGTYEVKVWVSNIDGNADMDMSNDTVSKMVIIGPPRPNKIASYISSGQAFYQTIGTVADQLDAPRDLCFHPTLTNYDLWVINTETENSGGSTVTYFDAGQPGQTDLYLKDGNAWHFMSLPTALDFGENGFWATSPGVYDANHNGAPPFTGPTLWSSDLAIYAQPSGGNGSHMDMLHESPYSMGIAHEVDNVYWVFDSENNDVVRYDFAEDHGPGNSYHDDAIVRRYPEISVSRINTNIACHMHLDKSTGWMYVVDGGNQRVLRFDINSGAVSGPATAPVYETLAEYTNVTGVTQEDLITTGLTEPSGIYVMGDYMLVSEHSNGDIIFYDISGASATEVYRIQTGSPGIQGIEIGPDGWIWYANANDNEIVKIEPYPLGEEEISEDNNIRVYPNPTRDGMVTISTRGSSIRDYQISVIDALGRTVYNNNAPQAYRIDLSDQPAGLYYVKLTGNGTTTIKPLSIAR